MFKTYRNSSSLVITSRWFATSRLVAPVSVRLVYCFTDDIWCGVDCYIVLDCWLWDCRWDVRQTSNVWHHPFVICWSKYRLGMPHLEWILGSCGPWKFPPFLTKLEQWVIISSWHICRFNVQKRKNMTRIINSLCLVTPYGVTNLCSRRYQSISSTRVIMYT